MCMIGVAWKKGGGETLDLKGVWWCSQVVFSVWFCFGVVCICCLFCCFYLFFVLYVFCCFVFTCLFWCLYFFYFFICCLFSCCLYLLFLLIFFVVLFVDFIFIYLFLYSAFLGLTDIYLGRYLSRFYLCCVLVSSSSVSIRCLPSIFSSFYSLPSHFHICIPSSFFLLLLFLQAIEISKPSKSSCQILQFSENDL